MKVSIIIPTLNRYNSLKSVFEDLKVQSYRDFEVIIIDGWSKDNTQDLCKEYNQYFIVKFYRQSQPGIVTAMVEALSFCSGDIITRTDDDVALSKDWLGEIVWSFKNCDHIGGVTGPTVIPKARLDKRDLTMFNAKLDKPKNIFWKIFKAVYYDYFMEGEPFAVSRFFKCGAFSLGSNYSQALEIKDIKEVDYLESCNWSVRHDLLKKVGGFDLRYGGVSEYFEADAVYRIKRLGYKMYFNPKAAIQHLVDRGGNFSGRSGTYSRAHNFILFYYKNIKPNTLDKFFRFFLYLGFINSYFVYCAFVQRNARQLTGLWGTFFNIFRYIPEIFK